jgi:sugar O-acyltransferase (sialic acid O-acetyltransferase NeuD family)
MILFGAGGHGKVVSSACINELKYFFDHNSTNKLLNGFAVKVYDPGLDSEELIAVSIGDNRVRKKLVDEIKHSFTSIVHKSAIIDSSCSIGIGSQVLHNVVLQVDSSLGAHTILNSSSSIDHDCQIGDFVHIAPNSTLCGNVEIGDGTLIGAGTTIIPGVKIGKWSIIGAGSVVVSDIPDNVLVFGNPAKIIRELE